MSVLESIFTWAQQDLANWQSDAVRRLLTQQSLNANDKADLLAMLKNRYGLGDAKKPPPSPQPLKKGDISGAPQVSAKITLRAMRNLSNVNAIPDGSSLSFGHEGLTVIYGENAAGKSGYARVLKRACSARDTEERILPNVYGNNTYAAAKATFKISVNGGPPQEIPWEDGQKGPDVLVNIAVFDSKCARAILDKNNKITYLPYGSHVFPGLVGLLQELRVKLEYEKPKPEPLQYDDISSTSKTGQFIDQLSYETSTASIEELAKWTKKDEEKLAELQKGISTAEAEDPVKRVRRIRRRKDRINELKDKITHIDRVLSGANADHLKKLINDLNAAEEALVIVSQESLAQEPLPGAGGNAWRMLYEAAKQYSIQDAYPGKDFPQTGEGSRCVLCMQALLDDAKKRLQRFKEFMEKTAKKKADSAAQLLEAALEKVRELDFTILKTYEDVLGEIRDRDEAAAGEIGEYSAAMEARAKDMIEAGTNKEIRAFSPSKLAPTDVITKIAQDLEKEAKKIEEAADPEKLTKLKSQRDELHAQKLFAERKQVVIDYVEQLKIAQKYDACIDETKHTGITIKGTEIISGALTPQLIKALKDELKALGTHHLKLSLKASGGYGETSHKMELPDTQPLQGIKLTDILSEGEQNVVGIAGFLAELKISGHECPIVLDDPVCSLDHRYREKVAERLAKEAAIRQVIIFTHDIAFLLELNSKAAELDNGKFVAQTVRYDDVPGRCTEGLPWHSMPVKRRLSYLDEGLNNIQSLYTDNLQEYNRQVGYLYGLLRETWEAAIEEVLFHNTIKRHAGEVHTLNLRYVTVTDDDYKTVFFRYGEVL